MKEITFKEIDNRPRYKVGEIIGAYLFDEYVVAMIDDVKVDPLSPYDLEKSKKKVHVCCGKTEFPIQLNRIKYITRLGGVYESGIRDVGCEAIQEKIRSLEEEIESYERRLREIRDLA